MRAVPKLIRFAAALAMLQLSVFVVAYLVYWIINRPGDRDFGSQYAAAYVGIHSGWSHIYDPAYLRPVETALGADGFSIFPHPPPVAWLAVPLAVLPWTAAALVFQVVLVLALAASVALLAPADRWGRVLIALSVAGFQPVLFAVGYATMSPLVLLCVAGALVAMRKGSQVVAGLLLGATVVKPQLTLLVLPVLLASGYWKAVVTAAGVMAVLALLSIAVIGSGGTHDFVAFTTAPEQLNHPMPWTIKGLVGTGTPSFIGTAIVVAAVVAVAIRFRPAPDLALSLGVLASLFVAQHLNYGDFVMWLPAIWIAFESGRPRWLGVVAGACWACGWFVVAVPLVAVAGELALAAGFVAVMAVRRPEKATVAVALPLTQ